MLIIAQPRTASTSFATALAELTGLGWKQELGLKFKKHKDFTYLSHSDMKIISYQKIRKWAKTKNCFYKQHLLPINKHMNNLLDLNAKYVVLLREPEQSIESYSRINIPKSERLLNEMIRWNKQAQELFLDNNFLHIWFEDIINNTRMSLYKTLNHFKFYNIKIPKNYRLPTKRYTRKG